MTQAEKARQILQKWQSDPVICYKSLFDNRLWSKQEEVIQSVWANDRTAVKSGNTVGKSRIAAVLTLMWLAAHKPAKVVTTAPGFSQVEGILWKEIKLLADQMKIKFTTRPLNTELNLAPDWFAVGISTNDTTSFQGRHSPRLLVIIDEAYGVDPEIWEAVTALHPYRVLAIGNPIAPAGEFYKCFQSPLWNKITISCLDAIRWQIENGEIPGLVTLKWAEEVAAEYGKDSAYYKAHILGEFPQDDESSLIKVSWVEDARKKELENTPNALKIIGADLATKHGANYSTLGYRVGHDIHELKNYLQLPALEHTRMISRKYSEKEADNIVFDADGLGENFGEMLGMDHLPYLEFHGGRNAPAIDGRRYKNLRTQCYYLVSEKFRRGMYSLKLLGDKEYELLKNQLCTIKTKYPDPVGRMQIETKEDLAARGITSPDMSDTFMMMEYSYFMGRQGDIAPMSYR
jgi:hypothetical protein